MTRVTILERHPTPAGTAVEITYHPHSGALQMGCTGCGETASTPTGARTWDPPEKEDALVDEALPEAREQAQAHAAACSEPHRPASAPGGTPHCPV